MLPMPIRFNVCMFDVMQHSGTVAARAGFMSNSLGWGAY